MNHKDLWRLLRCGILWIVTRKVIDIISNRIIHDYCGYGRIFYSLTQSSGFGQSGRSQRQSGVLYELDFYRLQRL